MLCVVISAPIPTQHAAEKMQADQATVTKVTCALISRLKFVRESFSIHELLADMKFTGSAAATEHVIHRLRLNPKLHWEVSRPRLAAMIA